MRRALLKAGKKKSYFHLVSEEKAVWRLATFQPNSIIYQPFFFKSQCLNT